MDTEVDVIDALEKTVGDGANECMLTFLHPEVSHGLTCDGIPQVNLDQMNPRQMMDPSFCTLAMKAQKERGEFIPDRPHNGLLMVVDCEGVLNYMTRAMKLTRGKLIRGESWREWHESEWKQLEQYDTQGMFSTP